MAQELTVFLWGGALILGLQSLMWLLSLKLRDAGIADVFWGIGFVLAALLYDFLTPAVAGSRQLILNFLLFIWGIRLAVHIWLRSRGKPEDYRYRSWREEHGKNWWWRSYLQVFLLQGFLMWIISLPLWAVHISNFTADLQWTDFLAIGLWLTGFFFEAVGDWQLVKFKRDPENKGKLLTAGLWRYTRHPNYFGDALQWWAYFLFAAINIANSWTVVSPLIMTWLLTRVSGVAMLERGLSDSRPQYRSYIESTNAFIPWFPRKSR